MIAEDCAILARSLVRLLGPHCSVKIGVSVAEVTALIPRQAWTGALFDFVLQDGVATPLITAFRARFPTAPLVVMSGASAPKVSALSLEHGAYFVAKPLLDLAWLDVLRRPATPVAPAWSARVALEARGCTAREAEVVDLYCSGKTADEVGVALRISTPTVRAHLTKACNRLGVANVKALQYALLQDLAFRARS